MYTPVSINIYYTYKVISWFQVIHLDILLNCNRVHFFTTFAKVLYESGKWHTQIKVTPGGFIKGLFSRQGQYLGNGSVKPKSSKSQKQTVATSGP